MDRAVQVSTLSLAGVTTEQAMWGAGVGIGTFIVTSILSALLIIFLPANYFCRRKKPSGRREVGVHWAVEISKNLLGVILIGLGIMMLVLPGPGVLTILIGLMMLSIPGKRKLAASLIRRTGALPPVNRFRARFGVAPLTLNGK